MEEPASYEFGEDWFNVNRPNFERHVLPLAGKPVRLLEIGSFEGRSTTWLIDNVMSRPESRLDCVDLVIQDRLRSNVERTGRAAQVAFHQGPSRAILRTLPLEAFDFIYVDGSHDTVAVLEDAVAAFQLARPGGIIAFDDYLWDAGSPIKHGIPKPAIDVFLALYAMPTRYPPLVEILPIAIDRQMWVLKLVRRGSASTFSKLRRFFRTSKDVTGPIAKASLFAPDRPPARAIHRLANPHERDLHAGRWMWSPGFGRTALGTTETA